MSLWLHTHVHSAIQIQTFLFFFFCFFHRERNKLPLSSVCVCVFIDFCVHMVFCVLFCASEIQIQSFIWDPHALRDRSDSVCLCIVQVGFVSLCVCVCACRFWSSHFWVCVTRPQVICVYECVCTSRLLFCGLLGCWIWALGLHRMLSSAELFCVCVFVYFICICVNSVNKVFQCLCFLLI